MCNCKIPKSHRNNNKFNNFRDSIFFIIIQILISLSQLPDDYLYASADPGSDTA